MGRAGPAAGREKNMHMVRRLGADVDRPRGIERQDDAAGMQVHVPRRRPGQVAAIDMVAGDRPAGMRAMDAELMRAAGLRGQLQPGEAIGAASTRQCVRLASPAGRPSSTSCACRRSGGASGASMVPASPATLPTTTAQ